MRTAPEIATWLTQRFAALVEIDPSAIDPDVPLEHYGVASSDVVFLTDDLSDYLGRVVSATVAWDHPTIADLSQFLAAVLRGEAELPDDDEAWDLDTHLYEL